MALDTFAAWFKALRGVDPYPWQIRLAAALTVGDWPAHLHLPTGAGKTTLLDVWAWGISQGLPGFPRRLYWCVDRRLVVDSVALQAESLMGVLPNLQTARLRGGLDLGDPGITDPSAPAVITTTVDQLGSRLLFRAYGSSRFVAPMHAALAGNDALIVLDEAHLSLPFVETLHALARYRRRAREDLGLPWRLMFLTATPRAETGFTLAPEDYAHPGLKARLGHPKPCELVECRADQKVQTLVEYAQRFRASGAAVVAVVVNRVATAREVFSRLHAHGEACLLTGRIREPERARLLEVYLPRMRAGSRQAGRDPLFVVATQTIEVGADLDFDALVSEAASLSALRQRFGRQNRTGELDQAPGAIIWAKERDDRIYGADTRTAWEWLNARAQRVGRCKQIDLAALALQDQEFPEELQPDFPVLGAADVAVLAQTSVPLEVDLSPWLHGYAERAEVFLVWRADLPEETAEWNAYVGAVPPVTPETLALPVWELQSWLEQHHATDPVVVWTGDEGDVRAGADARLRPGWMVVVPSHYGGYDAWGWAPSSPATVEDVGDTERRMRLHPALRPEMAELLVEYQDPDDPLSERDVLRRLEIMPRGAWRLIDYPGGLVLILGAPVPERVAGIVVSLEEHQRGAEWFARALTPPELPAVLRSAVAKAARQHDEGKADRRFQVALGSDGSVILAKSIAASQETARAAWRLSGLSPGWRHEIGSVARVADAEDDELVRYLIGTHHGRGRPDLPATPDPALWKAASGETWLDRHGRLTARYGYWGLAYLEALVRLADWAESRAEAEPKSREPRR